MPLTGDDVAPYDSTCGKPSMSVELATSFCASTAASLSESAAGERYPEAQMAHLDSER